MELEIDNEDRIALCNPDKIKEIANGEIIKALGNRYKEFDGIKFKFINLETFTTRT